jgi:hypothetical protein
MGYYHTALICKNGHVISDSIDSSPEFYEKYCSNCGAESIRQCERCNTAIRGDYEVEGVLDLTGRRMKAPSFCHNCGNLFPWSEARMQAAKELLDLTELETEEKNGFETSLKDISTDSPRTKLGALSIKKLLGKINSQEMRSALFDIVKQVAVKEATKLIG